MPIAHVALRIVIILNWIGGAGIFALLVVLPHEQWILQTFRLTPSPDTTQLIFGLRAVAALGLVAIPINDAILTRLLAMVQTVRAGIRSWPPTPSACV